MFSMRVSRLHEPKVANLLGSTCVDEAMKKKTNEKMWRESIHAELVCVLGPPTALLHGLCFVRNTTRCWTCGHRACRKISIHAIGLSKNGCWSHPVQRHGSEILLLANVGRNMKQTSRLSDINSPRRQRPWRKNRRTKIKRHTRPSGATQLMLMRFMKRTVGARSG